MQYGKFNFDAITKLCLALFGKIFKYVFIILVHSITNRINEFDPNKNRNFKFPNLTLLLFVYFILFAAFAFNHQNFILLI